MADWERRRAVLEQAAELGRPRRFSTVWEGVAVRGEHRRAIELKERGFAEYERRGLRVEAAELARWLGVPARVGPRNVAAANGWMARAERLLEESRSLRRTDG